MARFSLCISAKGAAADVVMTIASVFAQTLDGRPAASDAEVIVATEADDAETAATVRTLAGLFRFSHIEIEGGEAARRMTLLAHATGDFVGIVSTCEWMVPGALQTLKGLFEENPKLVACCAGGEGRVTGYSALHRFKGRAIASRPDLIDTLVRPGASVFLRRAALRGVAPMQGGYLDFAEREQLYRIAEAHPQAVLALVPGLIGRAAKDKPDFAAVFTALLDRITFWLEAAEAAGEAQPALQAALADGIASVLRRAAEVKINEPDTVAYVWDCVRALCDHEAFPRLAVLRADDILSAAAKLPGGIAASALVTDPLLAAQWPDGDLSMRARETVAGLLAPGAMPSRTVTRAQRIIDNDNFLAPVIVSGFHHSGTRLLAQALEIMGVFQVANTDAFEWSYIQQVNTVILPRWMDPQAVDAFKGQDLYDAISPERLALRLAASGWTGQGMWGHKDPRNSVTLKAWLAVFPRARVVHIVRDAIDTLATLPESYARYSPTGQMPQLEGDFWSHLWLAYERQAQEAMAAHAESIEITFEVLCTDPVATLGTLAAFLKLPNAPSKEEIAGLNIDGAKRGVHREWLSAGRVGADQVEIIRRATTPQTTPPSAELPSPTKPRARRRKVADVA